MFARTITAKLPPTSPVVFNSVNPGFVHSEIRRDVPWMLRPIFGLLGLIFARTTPEGAKTYVWPALVGKSDANIRDRIRGAYTSDCEIGDFSDFLLSTNGQAVEKRIWVSWVSLLFICDQPPDNLHRTRRWRYYNRLILGCRKLLRSASETKTDLYQLRYLGGLSIIIMLLKWGSVCHLADVTSSYTVCGVPLNQVTLTRSFLAALYVLFDSFGSNGTLLNH
jgi:hypothetical protein